MASRRCRVALVSRSWDRDEDTFASCQRPILTFPIKFNKLCVNFETCVFCFDYRRSLVRRSSPLSAPSAHRLGPFNVFFSVCFYLENCPKRWYFLYVRQIWLRNWIITLEVNAPRRQGEEDEEKWWAKRSLQESALILGLCVDYVMLFPNLGAFRPEQADKRRQKTCDCW